MLEEAFNTDQLVQGIEGKVIAELFDAKTGELVQREETHNFIAKPALDFLKQAQRSQFTRGIQTLNGTLNQDYFQVDKSDAQLVLTDNASAEDAANETHMYGRLIGWADKVAYSGADIYRGTPNGALCNATDSQVQWVFDWPTSAANGTINSIGWVKMQHINTSLPSPSYAAYSKATAQFTTPQDWRYFTRASGSQSFGNTGNTTISILDGSYAQTGTFSVSTQFTAVQGIAWDSSNSKLWVIGTSTSVAKIASYNSSGTLVDALVTVTNRTYTAMAFDGTGLWTTTQTPGTGAAIIYKINTSTGADISNFSFTTNEHSAGQFSTICGIAYEPSRQMLWIREFNGYNTSGGASLYPNEVGVTEANVARQLARILCFNTSGQQIAMQVSLYMITQQYGTLVTSGVQHNSAIEAPYAQSYIPDSLNRVRYYYVNGNIDRFGPTLDLDVIDQYNFIIPHDNRVYHATTDGLGSRALLGLPIVKTNSQTLRITYQVNFS